ncbi:MAG: type II secretion system protein [Phycisphaerae bacterium]|nr:type II secretion system protein [Phycisphaerae bacterium]
MTGTPTRRSSSRQSIENATAAFSLVEALVVMGVIAILLAISLPLLRASRKRADLALRLAGQQQCLVGLLQYTTDFKGGFPFIGEQGVFEKYLRFRGWRDNWPSPYFKVDSVFWPSVVVPTYSELIPDQMHAFADDPSADWFVYEGRGASAPANPFISTSFRLTHTTSAVPAYWITEEPPEDLTLLRGTRVEDVRAPSKKGLLLDVRAGFFAQSPPPALEGMIAVAFGDGSASWQYPVPRTAEHWGVERIGLGAASFPIMTTRQGILGQDF